LYQTGTEWQQAFIKHNAVINGVLLLKGLLIFNVLSQIRERKETRGGATNCHGRE
jgi:hypothetical protein